MHLSRRAFLSTAAAASVPFRSLRADIPGLRLGVTDWNLNMGANAEAIPAAARLGFQGVQISFGRHLIDGKLPLDDPQIIQHYLELSRKHNLPINGTCVDKLHDNGLKSDPLAPRWVLDSIRLTKDLNVRVLLLPFFGRWAIKTPAERDYTGDRLRELAPEAAKANVILGLEDTISAEDNVRIMDRARSSNVLVYYDIGNSTVNGFDIVKEIRWLGRERICQFHFKDNPHFFGEGSIQLEQVMKAVKDIGWTGWGNLETDIRPEDNVDAGLRRNLAFIRKVIQQA